MKNLRVNVDVRFDVAAILQWVRSRCGDVPNYPLSRYSHIYTTLFTANPSTKERLGALRVIRAPS